MAIYEEIMSMEEAESNRDALISVFRKGLSQNDMRKLINDDDNTKFIVWESKVGITPIEQSRTARSRDEEAYWRKRIKELIASEFVKRTDKKIIPYGVIQNTADKKMMSGFGYFIEGEEAGMTPIDVYAKFVDKEIEAQDMKLSTEVSCQWNMAVTGLSKWYLAVLYGGSQFFIKTIERDPITIELMKETADKFWKTNVKMRRHPDVDDSIACSKALDRIFKGGKKKRKTYNSEDYKLLVEDIVSARKQMHSIHKFVIGRENELKSKLQNTETAVIGKYFVTWLPEKEWHLDFARLKFEHEDIYRQYLIRNDVRNLKIVKKE